MTYQEPEWDHPLSSAQLRWWVAQHLYPDISNTVAMYLDLTGPLDRDLMRDCSRRAARELESPGLRVRSVDGHPRQRVTAGPGLEWNSCELAPHPEPVTEALARMERDHRAPLDPHTDELTVATLYRIAVDRHLLYLRSHHLVLDGAGAVALLRRTGELYRAATTGAAPPDPAALDTVGLLAAEREYRQSPRAAADRDYWRSELAGLGEPVGLAGHPAAPRPRPHRASVEVEAATAAAVSVARVRHSAGFGELVIAAFGCYLSRLTGNDDTVLALPVPARTSAALRRSAGSVSNVVPLRLTGIAQGTVGGAVGQVRGRVLGALRHQRYPYEDIQRDRTGGRVVRGGFGPVINVLGFVEPLRLGPVTGHAQLLSLGPVEDLLVNCYQWGLDERTIRIDFQGNPARYSARTLARYHRDFVTYLGCFLAADARTPIDEVELPTGAVGVSERSIGEAEDETRGGRGTSDAGSEVPTLSELLRRALRPENYDRVAVSDDERSLTYRELDALARRWSRTLAAAGAGPGVGVATVIPRSIESVVAVWAVATCGAYPVPIDPGDPRDRIEKVLTDSGIRSGLTVSTVRAGLPGDATGNGVGSVHWFDLDIGDPDTVRRAIEEGPDTCGDPIRFGASETTRALESTDSRRRSGAVEPAVSYRSPGAPLLADHPAYLIHTSGTTGAPKGVLVGHRGLGPLTDHIVGRYRVDADSVVLHAHSPAFDAHLLELLAAFAAGARLVIAPPEATVGADLARVIRAAGVTHLLSTPAVLGTLDPADLPTLQVVVTGGEAPSAQSVRRWAPRVRFHNGYGPTEATVMVTQSEPLLPEDPVLIGPALPGVRAVLLDRQLRSVPVGGRAELYLGGPGVALGYPRDPGATAARFVADPAGGGRRLYRTGDLVRSDPDGFEYLGRVDRQLTLHGRRIEPDEIESVLTAAPEIAQAVVAVVGGPGPGARLVGYVVPAADQLFDAAATLRRLRTVLPAALVPAVLTPLDRIPLTANGKLDRAALPDPRPTRAYRPPETEIQQLVAERIAQVLGCERVGLDDDFFALGGNSLSGVGLSADLAQAAGAPVTVRWLYTAPTVVELADRIRAHRAVETEHRVPGVESARSAYPTDGAEDGSGSSEGLEVLLPLRRTGTGAPLFCFHSAVPLAWSYAGLSRYIEDRPVFGVQSPALTGSGADTTTAEALAERYVREIVQVQSAGPYHLLGWSLGGQLAHAVAVRLRELGQEVALLAMLDSVVFPQDSPPPPRPQMRDLLTHLLGDEPGAARAEQAPDLTAAEAAAHLAATGADSGTGLTAGQLDSLHRAYIAGVEISHRYRPRIFDGDLLYFSATLGTTELLDAGSWRPYVSRDLIEHPVPAEHGQMTGPGAVAVIGPILARHLSGLTAVADSRRPATGP